MTTIIAASVLKLNDRIELDGEIVTVITAPHQSWRHVTFQAKNDEGVVTEHKLGKDNAIFRP